MRGDAKLPNEYSKRRSGFFLEFIERIKGGYPEIYESSGGEKQAVDYFSKWGWYVTIDMMAGNDILKIDRVLEIPVHEFHTFLAHNLDRQNMEAILRKGNNVTQL